MRVGRIVLYAGVIFLAGLVTGALLAPMAGRTFLRHPGPEQMSREMMSRLQSRLQLAPEQKTQVQPIIDRTSADMVAIRRETTKRVSKRIEETNREISVLLTPEQKVKFDKMEAERRKRLGYREPPGPPPPPTPR
jgi:Spy/CpxP family protein refolding chaperone